MVEKSLRPKLRPTEPMLRPKLRPEEKDPKYVDAVFRGERGRTVTSPDENNPITMLGLTEGDTFRETERGPEELGINARGLYYFRTEDALGGPVEDGFSADLYASEHPDADPLQLGDILIFGEKGANPQTVAHEFMHRGFNKLREDYTEEEVAKRYGDSVAKLLFDQSLEHALVQSVLEKEGVESYNKYFNRDNQTDSAKEKIDKTVEAVYELSNESLGNRGFQTDRDRGPTKRPKRKVPEPSIFQKFKKMIGLFEGGMAEIDEQPMGFQDQMDEIFVPEFNNEPETDEERVDRVLGRRPGFRSLEEAKGQVSQEELMAGVDNAASFLVPFYGAGVNVSNVVQEYMKPEDERDYDYINDELGKAGESAALEAGLMIAGLGVGKFAGKGIEALANKVKQYEIDPSAMSSFGVGAIKKKESKPLEIGINTFLEDGKFLKNYDADTAATMAENAKKANAGNKRANALINAEVPEGTRVGVRLNLNSTIPDSPKGLDKLQTLHKGSFSGKAMSYLPFATVRNVSFNVSQKGRTAIASRIKGIDTPEAKAKYPAMSVDGDYVPNKNLLDEGGDLIEIGLNPANHHLFIDLKTGQAVKGAEEATVIGDRIYARGVEYWKKAEAPDPLPTQSGEDILSDVRYKYNQGGVAMNEQMEMAFMKEGGIKDDGMRVDPVSGNEIPPGSMASEVRDDIPAMLSEGEYVVPADVLRFYGVNFFEDLRNKAKSGLQNMEQNGRIGGEPISPEQIQQNMGQTPAPMQANEGGVVGYQGGGGPVPNQYMQQAQQLSGQTFNPSQWSTVGGSMFQQPQQQEEIITTKTFVNATNPSDKRTVQYVNGQLSNPDDSKYTQAPYYEQGSSALKKAMKAQESQGGGGESTPTPTPTGTGKGFQDWGSDVDWSDPLAYAKSLQSGKMGKLGNTALKGAAMLGGPAAMTAVGVAQTGMGLQQISDLRAASIIAKAQGMDEQAKEIDGMVSDILGKSSNAVNFLDDLVATGTKKATTALDRMGMKYTRDKETGKITFNPEDIQSNTARGSRPGLSGDTAASRAEIAKELEVMSQPVGSNGSGSSRDTMSMHEQIRQEAEDFANKSQEEKTAQYESISPEFAAIMASNKGGLMSRKKTKKK
jgi:hypothetical protein